MAEDKTEEEVVEEKSKFDPEMVALIRSQVLEELESKEERERQTIIQQREEQKEVHEEYVAKMKASSEPWVDIQGWVQTEQGIRVELDWNDAMVKYLRDEGISGTDDEQVVQKWVTMLMHDMAGQMEEEAPEQSDFE